MNFMLMTRKTFSLGALSIALIALPFSITVCHTALIVFLILWITEGSWNEKFDVAKKSVMVQLILAFTILQLAGMLYTENVSNGWFSLEKKIFFFLIPIALATSSVKFEKKDVKLIFYLFTGACLIGSFICLYFAMRKLILFNEGAITLEHINYLNSSYFKELNPFIFDQWLLFSYVELAKGINIHPSYFSLYLAFCVVFLLYQLLTGENQTLKKKLVAWLIISYFTIFIVSLSSRIVIFSLLALYVLLLADMFITRKLKIASWSLMGLIIILAATLYINPVSRYRNLQEIGSSSLTIQPHTVYKNSTEIRASLWWLAWKSFSKINPLWGAGSGDVNDIILQLSKEYNITNILDSYNPHNEFLHVVIGNGIIGLLIFVSLLALPFYLAWIDQDYLCLAFIFLFAALCFTETALELQKGIVFFSIIFPLLTFHRQSFQLDNVTVKIFSARG